MARRRRRPSRPHPRTSAQPSAHEIAYNRAVRRNQIVFGVWFVICVITAFAIGDRRPLHLAVTLAVAPLFLVALVVTIRNWFRKRRSRGDSTV